MFKPTHRMKLAANRTVLVQKQVFRRRVASTKGVYILREFQEKPLYRPSARQILVFSGEKQGVKIIFRRPPIEKPVYTEGMIRNVFGK